MADPTPSRAPGRRRVLLGTLVGVLVGIGLTAALTFGTVALSDGDDYEILDPVLVMGVPVTLIGAALGATVGAWPRRPR